MTEQEIIEQIIIPTIDHVNHVIPFLNIDKNKADLVFFGQAEAVLDSLNLVSFIFELENVIFQKFNRIIKITAADILDSQESPFSSMHSLALFLKSKIS